MSEFSRALSSKLDAVVCVSVVLCACLEAGETVANPLTPAWKYLEAPQAEAAAGPAPSPPPAAQATAAAPGAGDYGNYCASCHGAHGDGDGPLAGALDPQPAKHSDGDAMGALSDEYLFRVIREGGAAVGKSPLMAPWKGTLSDSQIRDLVAFIRTLSKPTN